MLDVRTRVENAVKRYRKTQYNYIDIMKLDDEVPEEFQKEFKEIRKQCLECNKSLETIQRERDSLERRLNEKVAKLNEVRSRIDWNSEIPKSLAKEQVEAEKACSESITALNEKMFEEKKVVIAISKLYRRANAILLS